MSIVFSHNSFIYLTFQDQLCVRHWGGARDEHGQIGLPVWGCQTSEAAHTEVRVIFSGTLFYTIVGQVSFSCFSVKDACVLVYITNILKNIFKLQKLKKIKIPICHLPLSLLGFQCHCVHPFSLSFFFPISVFWP